eukprot:358860-Chlamydomonas_euryale.AAC.5
MCPPRASRQDQLHRGTDTFISHSSSLPPSSSAPASPSRASRQGHFHQGAHTFTLPLFLPRPPRPPVPAAPPGKTSFIKALAQYTKRSVISIPLTKIRTNQELMDIMFDQARGSVLSRGCGRSSRSRSRSSRSSRITVVHMVFVRTRGDAERRGGGGGERTGWKRWRGERGRGKEGGHGQPGSALSIPGSCASLLALSTRVHCPVVAECPMTMCQFADDDCPVLVWEQDVP